MEPDAPFLVSKAAEEAALTEDASSYSSLSTSTLSRKTPWLLHLTTLLCLGLASLVFVFTFCQVEIAVANKFTHGLQNLYAVLVTAVATMISAFTARQIQTQWLHKINITMAQSKDPEVLSRLEQSWRSSLGIAAFMDRLTKPHTWLNQLCYVSAALITTALVAATVPTMSTRTDGYQTTIPSGAPPNSCFQDVSLQQSIELKQSGPARGMLGPHMEWTLPTGGLLQMQNNKYECPSSLTLAMIASINSRTPESYAYMDLGVAIQRSALGAHFSLYSAGLDFPAVQPVQPAPAPSDPDPLPPAATTTMMNSADLAMTGEPTSPTETEMTTPQTYDREVSADTYSSVLQLSQCAPIVARNPVACSVSGGTISILQNAVGIISGGISLKKIVAEPSNAFAGEFITSHGTGIGTGMIYVGATGDMALQLAAAMNDTRWFAHNLGKLSGKSFKTVDRLKYFARCYVDVAPTIKWQQLILAQKSSFSLSIPSQRSLSGGYSCTPDDGVDINHATYAAIGASGLQYPLREYVWHGEMPTIISRAINPNSGHRSNNPTQMFLEMIRSSDFAFENSRNGLEDVLGLAAALAISRMPTISFTDSGAQPSDKILVNGTKITSVYRVGNGRLYTMVYALPPLIVAFFAVILAVTTPRTKTEYKSSKMTHLIRYGKNMQR